MADRTATLTALLKDAVSAPAAKIRGEFTALGEAGGKLGSVLHGIGAGIGIAIFNELSQVFDKIASAIPDLITRGLAFAETVDKIQDATRATAETASHFVGELQYLGINAEGVASKIGILSKGIAAQESTLNSLGVSIRDANGHYLDQITIINRARSALSGMEDGLAKTKLSIALFGRAGAEMLDWLSMTDEQVGILDTKLDALGVTMSQAMVDNAENARREGNLLNLAMQGLSNTLTADVAPALIVAVDSIVNFIQTNGKAIAQFASEVVGFVLGMIGALTGATVQTVSFTSEIDAAGRTTQAFNQALDDSATKHTKAGGAAKANTDALDHEIRMTASAITAVTNLEAAQDRAYAKDMARISAKLGAELDLLSASEKAHSIAEQQTSQAQQMADAQQALADAQAGSVDSEGVRTVDTRAIEQAQRQITSVAQSQADLQTSIEHDARRDQIKVVQDYVDHLTQVETQWTSKKGWLAQLQKDEAVLASQSAAQSQAGDLQAVADTAVKLEAVKTAEARAQAGARAADQMTDLEKQKAHFEAIKKAAQAATTGGGGIGPLFKDGSTIAGDAIAKLAGDTTSEMHGIAASVSDKQTGLVGAMEEAKLAGVEFGNSMKVVVGEISDAFRTLFGWIGDVKKGLDEIANSEIWKFLNQPIDPGALARDAHRFSQLHPYDPYGTGPIAPPTYNPYGTNSSTQGVVNVHPGAITVNGALDPAATAAAIIQELKREQTRQGMSLAGP